MAILTPLFGLISDFSNKKLLMIIGSVSIALLSYFLFNMFLLSPFFNMWILGISIGAGGRIINGIYAALIAELFPPNIRYSGMGFSYSTGIAIFAGFGPLILTYLIKLSSINEAPFYYFSSCILITLVALAFYPKHSTANTELRLEPQFNIA